MEKQNPNYNLIEISKYSDAVMEGLKRLKNPTAIGIDMDGVWLKNGKIPQNLDGSLDLLTLQEQSPETIEIVRKFALLELHGIPVIPITGKSATAALLFELKGKFMLEEAEKLGMIEKNPGYSLGADPVIIKEFQSPIEGRMYARNSDGTVNTKRLVFDLAEYDNGAVLQEWSHKDNAVEYSNKFPKKFFKRLLNPELLELLELTTRKEKTERLVGTAETTGVNDVHISQVLYTAEDYTKFTDIPDDKLIPHTIKKVNKISYGSPWGTKFNFELVEIGYNSDLITKWTAYARKIYHDENITVNSLKDIETVLQYAFTDEDENMALATVSTNFVHEDNAMGDRIVIDLNPPGTDKEVGLRMAFAYMTKIYEEAGMEPPPFEEFCIGIGDGPMRNDDALVRRERGVTNTFDDHDKIHGFPVDMLDIFSKYGFTLPAHAENKLDTEQTLLYMQLILLGQGILTYETFITTLPQKIKDLIQDITIDSLKWT